MCWTSRCAAVNPAGSGPGYGGATAVDLQASFEEPDASRDAMGQRAERLAERLDSVVAGGQSQPLESWMEELLPPCQRPADHGQRGR